VDRPNPNSAPVAPSEDWESGERTGILPLPLPRAAEPPIPLVLAPAPTPHPDPGPSFGETFRRLVQILAAFVCVFLVLRSVGLEPFGVPTGSMAECLVGNHREGGCPRCGAPVRVGLRATRPPPFERSKCPNCGESVDLSAAPEIPGDRVLVDKTVYSLRPPRRWEVAVFRCPVDDTKPYVKRVVGLPGELVLLADGDAYANGELLRKNLSQVRETAVPVFDMRFAPPGGWHARWLVEPVVDPKLPPAGPPAGPKPPDETILRDSALFLDAAATPDTAVGLTYRHWQFDTKADDAVRDWLAYNGPPTERSNTPVHDFALSFDLEVLGGSGTVACRLGDGGDHVTAELGAGFAVLGSVEEVPAPPPPKGKKANPPPPPKPATQETVGAGVPLEVGKTYRVEFSFVDRRGILAVNGVEVASPLDLPPKPKGRRAVDRPLQIGARGMSVAVRNLKLFRDIHYRTDGRNTKEPGCQLGPDEYFMLGDNSADSQDSREWKTPGVPAADFIGKPFLIHQPMRVGKVTVNGQDRTFQTVDWARLRWLR
jgi:signal peptidase I